MTKLTPTTRTLRWLENQGWRADSVEQRISRTVSRDLFGLFDVIAVKDGDTLAVQVTSTPNVSARVKKLEAAPDVLADCRKACWLIHVHGWGGKWQDEPRVVDVS